MHKGKNKETHQPSSPKSLIVSLFCRDFFAFESIRITGTPSKPYLLYLFAVPVT